jgi:hypothetical protein
VNLAVPAVGFGFLFFALSAVESQFRSHRCSIFIPGENGGKVAAVLLLRIAC